MSSVTVYEINKNNLVNNIPIFTDIIFKNFSELANVSYVKHSKRDISDLLKSDQLFGYIVRASEKIIAYLVGEITTTPDGRHAYYLSYIYVLPKYQKLKIGTHMMKKLIEHCKKFGIPFVVLTCDTTDTKLMHFYKKFGFILDPILKNGKQHDVMCLYM